MDKRSVALRSVYASLGLTAAKLIVAVLSGSLALFSESLHSLLDLMATIVTWQSVRISDLPADESHHYGHDKIESLAAFAEGILLMLTAIWIAHRAVIRLLHTQHAGNAAVWPFAVGVVILSIVVDISRGISLSRAARKLNSVALAADARHYQTDLVASCVVLLTLLTIRFGGPAYQWADPAGAMLIALIMLITGIVLVRRAADVLMDRAPAGLESRVQEAIRRVPGVCDVPRVRARHTGSQTFVDATITVDPKVSLEEGHRIASSAELATTEKYPHMDITFHVEPALPETTVEQTLQALGKAMQLSLHAVRVRDLNGRLYINFHLELPPDTSLKTAHRQVSELEDRIRMRVPNVAEIDSHVEPSRQGEPV